MRTEFKIDELFKKAASAPVDYSFSEASKWLHSAVNAGIDVSPKGSRGSIITKTLIIMSILLSAIAIVVLVNQSSQLPGNESKKDERIPVLENQFKPQSMSVEKNSISKNQINTKKERSETFLNGEQLQMEEKQPLIEEFTLNKDLIKQTKPFIPTVNEQYLFPKLTPDEIAENHKRKEKLLKSLSKLDKKEYAYIPSGTFMFQNAQTSVQAFYMQTAEVTNIEYKTFLFDLLINNKRDEFLKAKPAQELWVKIFGDSLSNMTESYFTEEEFYDYPVVNISREGAEMYCYWITVEARKYMGEKNSVNFNDVRLPLRVEWELAASESGKKMPYPWGSTSVTNEKNCFLANLNTKQFKENNATVLDTSTVEFRDGAELTARTKTYYPNEYGLYNMSGNVAEMVYDDYKIENGSRKKIGPGTAGGGWMSNEEELKINGVDQHKGLLNEHPNVGFRVVMTYFKQQN